MNSTLPLRFIRSGSYKAIYRAPEPVQHGIATAPAEAPFKVKFDIVGGRDGTGDYESEHSQRIDLAVRDRCRLHFGGVLWVLRDGRIVERNFPLDLVQRFRKRPEIELQINFGMATTLHSALGLPAKSGPIDDLQSGFPCEAWRLCLSRKGNDKYHDHIMVYRKSFVLQSVFLEHAGIKK
jgi:hypothetical protein